MVVEWYGLWYTYLHSISNSSNNSIINTPNIFKVDSLEKDINLRFENEIGDKNNILLKNQLNLNHIFYMILWLIKIN